MPIKHTTLNDIYEWMVDIQAKEPSSYAEYFFEDIVKFIFPDFMDDSDRPNPDLPLSPTLRRLFSCKTKKEVQAWMVSSGDQIGSMLEVECAVENFFYRMY